MANIGTDIVYATIAPKTTSSEFISFTGITQNADGTATLTGVTRGLSRSTPFTESATFKLPHSGQSQLILSNSPQQINEYVTKRNAETVSGIKTFATGATPLITDDPTTDLMAANKKYVDATASFGAPLANTSTAGIVQQATQAQVDAKTADGSEAKLYINPANLRATNVNDYVASDTGSANDYEIATDPVITAYAEGQVFIFKATNANTTASTLNVCATGTVSLVKNNDVALVAGDIEAGQVVVCVYDGTNMQIVSQNGHDPAALYQILANLDTTVTLGASDTKYPSQNAVKTYVDTNIPLHTNKIGIDSTTHTQSGAGATNYNITIPANTLGTNNAIRVRINYASNAGNGQSVHISFGDVTVNNTGAVSGTTTSGFIEHTILASGATNSQIHYTQAIGLTSSGSTIYQVQEYGQGTSSTDSTSAFDLPVSIIVSNGGSGSVYSYIIEAIRN
jgi:hypothetical protein